MDIVCLVVLALAGTALTILALRDFPVLEDLRLQALCIVALLLLILLYWTHDTIAAPYLKGPLFIFGLIPSVPFWAHVIRGLLVRTSQSIVSLDRVELAPSASRAEAAERRRDYAEAERLYREVIVKEPREPTPRWRLAELLAKLGRTDEAIEEYRKLLGVLRAPSDKYMVTFDIADLLANQKKDIWAAIAEMEAILKEFPDSASATYARERIESLRGRIGGGEDAGRRGRGGAGNA